MKQIYSAVFGIGAATVTFLFGGWDAVLYILFSFMILDYITGIIKAIKNKAISSEVGMRGLLKKCAIIMVVIVAVMLDRLTGNTAKVFRDIVCYFYIANEGISILENVVDIGVPVPKKLVSILDNISKKENKITTQNEMEELDNDQED